MAEKHYSFKKAKRSVNREDRNKYRRLKVLVNKKVRSSEAEHYKGLINYASDPKQLWQFLSSIVGNNNHGSSALHIKNGKHLLRKDKKFAFKFNKFFSSIGSKVASKLRNVAMNAWEKYENNNTGHDLWDLCPVDHKTIFDIVHLLKSNKAAGLDKIPTTLIRDAESELTPSIAYLVNKSIRDGKFPALCYTLAQSR